MLSDAEKKLYNKRATTENTMFANLDRFFEDPSDENLATLQDIRAEHRKIVREIGTAYSARKAAEEAAERMRAASAITSYTPTPMYTYTSTTSTGSVSAADVEKRMNEMRKLAEQRVLAAREEVERRMNTEKNEAPAEKPSLWRRLFND